MVHVRERKRINICTYTKHISLTQIAASACPVRLSLTSSLLISKVLPFLHCAATFSSTSLHIILGCHYKTPPLISSSTSTNQNNMAGPARPSIQIRNAQAQDAASVAKLGAHVFALTFGHSVAPHELQAYLDESYSPEATEKDISDPSKTMLVATDPDGRILGFALLTRGSTEPCIEHIPNTVELQRIYVDPEFHGNGVGKILAMRLEDLAREEGFVVMWLGVWEENVKAMKVYEKMGYKQVGDHDFVIGGVVQTDHIMIKTL